MFKKEKKSDLLILEDSIDRRFKALRDRIVKVEDKFDVEIYNFKPVCKDWKELFNKLSEIKKTIRKYDPNEVAEIVITPNVIRVQTFHIPKEKIIKIKRRNKND